jgi:hypothetical protein
MAAKLTVAVLRGGALETPKLTAVTGVTNPTTT